MVAGCPAKYAEGSFQTQARNFLFLSCVRYTLGMGIGNTHWVYSYSFYLTITIITHQDSNGTFPLLEHIPSCQVHAYGASYAAGGERQPCLPSAGIPVQIYFRTLKSQRFGNGSLPTLTHEAVNGKLIHVSPSQAEEYHTALTGAGATTSLTILEGEDHFSIVESLAEAGSPSSQALLHLIHSSPNQQLLQQTGYILNLVEM